MKTASALLLISLALPSVANAGDVLVVDPGGGGDYSTLSAAVLAAVDGDVLLLRAGVYPPQWVEVSGKALTITIDPNSGLPPGHSLGTSRIVVRNLPVGGTVHLSGNLATGLDVINCAGDVLIEDWNPVWSPMVVASDSVTFVGCTLRGGSGGTSGKPWGDPGFPGVDIVSSSVALYDSHVIGGEGGYGSWTPCPIGGDGGPALQALSSHILLSRTPLTPGLGQCDACGCGSRGAPMNVQNSTLQVLTAPDAKFESPAVLREGEAFLQTVHGTPGALAVRLVSTELQFRELPGPIGTLHMAPPFAIEVLGAIPPTGSLIVPGSAPFLGPGDEARVRFEQVYVVLPGTRVLSNPRATVVLDENL